MKILLAPSERKTVGGDFPPSQKLLLFLKRFIKKQNIQLKNMMSF